MTNEEKYLKERVGQENPFRTPEGYFDQFTANIMAQLPERQPMESKSVTKKVAMPIRHWFYAAACVAALLVTAFSFHFHQGDDSQQLPYCLLYPQKYPYQHSNSPFSYP